MHKRTYDKYIGEDEEPTALEQIEDYCSARLKMLGDIIFQRNTWLAISGVLNVYLLLYMVS